MRFLSSVPRWIISASILFGGLFTIAYAVPALERRGMPAGIVAGGVLVVLMLASIRVVLGEFPPRGRRRMLADLAAERGLRFRVRPRLPRSMARLPSLSDSRRSSWDAWHLIVLPVEPAVLTFDRRVSPEDAHEPPTWFASAARPIPIEAPSLIVEPRPAITADPLGPLLVWTSESEAFAHRARIRTTDRYFATAFLDQRMLAWLIDQDPTWTFEVGGPWAMVSRPPLARADRFDDAIRVVDGFCERIPRAALSMYASSSDAR